MSQQINLFNPSLIPRRDWLNLPLVLGVALLIILAQGALFTRAKVAVARLEVQERTMSEEAKNLQEQVMAISKQVSEIRPDPSLQKEIDARNEELAVGADLMRALRSMSSSETGFSAQMLGFARQSVNGLWLTDFSVTQEGLSIKGRMMDSNLLPEYIKRLNADPAFQGRKFAALEMKVVEPAKPDPSAPVATKGRQAVKLDPVYTEFSLLGVLPKDAAPGSLAAPSKPKAPNDSFTSVEAILGKKP